MIEQIKEYAGAFRKAIQSMPLSDFPDSSFFERFPKGCCGDTSDLFSKFLHSKGIKTYYVSGTRGRATHAWLEYDDVVIDLTADQFDDVTEEVMVSRSKKWHSQFEDQRKRESGFDNFNDYNSLRLRIIYDNIIKLIE